MNDNPCVDALPDTSQFVDSTSRRGEYIPGPAVAAAGMGPVGSSLKEMEAIPSGNSELMVSLSVNDAAMKQFVAACKQVTMAGVFAELVKERHTVPQDADTWKRYGVVKVGYELTTGHYAVSVVSFKDGSFYEVGKGVR